MSKKSSQDDRYLTEEGDSFFQRNFGGKNLPELRPNKATILEQLEKAELKVEAMLEYGCNYGDLLALYKEKKGARRCVGVEASKAAIAFGQKRYESRVDFHHGTVADNPVNADRAYDAFFDLVVVDDVFGWISRETLYQSVANIDGILRDGGHLFIRDFYPQAKVKNANHHVADGSVFNYKVPGSHVKLFVDSGIYEIVSQRIFVDKTPMSSTYRSHREFESRWADTILKKSYRDYFIG